MDPLLASIILFAGNFAPRGWAFCDGQLLAIAANTALFSLLGTTYGGDGRVNFALPDLRGRVPIHEGQGPGLSYYALGQAGGSENVTLTLNNIPRHSQPLVAISEPGNVSNPAGAYPANTGTFDREYRTSGTPVNMHTGAVGEAGGSQPFNNVSPYLVLNFIIATQGVFPSRS